MFEIARGIARLFRPDSQFTAPRDGLVGGDAGLAELVNLDLLRGEAKAADVAAGRISAKDRPMLQLRAAAMWREVARRSGDEAALRKAAGAAEDAVKGLDRRARPEAFARARIEQAECALLGVELGGDEGLAAAAAAALADAKAATPKSAAGAYAEVLLSRITGREALLRGEPQAAVDAAVLIAPLALLDRDRRERSSRRTAALAKLARAELLAACGVSLRDEGVLERALEAAVRAGLALDPAYEPVTWSRIQILRGEILTCLGETTGDTAAFERAAEVLKGVFDQLPRDHSPLDWAQAQYWVGRVYAALAEISERASALEDARAAFDRAVAAIGRSSAHPLRAAASQARGLALIRQAEMLGDLMALDGAEAGLRCELAAADPAQDEVAWAVCQVSLAQVYLARLSMTGRDRGERAKAAMALDMALEVFSERGLRGLSAVARDGLQRLGAIKSNA